MPAKLMMKYVSTDLVARRHSDRQTINSSTVMEPQCSLLCSHTHASLLPWNTVHALPASFLNSSFNFFEIKPTRCTNFTNLFCHETLHVSDSSSVHHQEFIHCTLGTGICYMGLKTAFKQHQVLVLLES